LAHPGKIAANKKMKRLHDQAVVAPIQLEEMTQLERKRAGKSHLSFRQERWNCQGLNL